MAFPSPFLLPGLLVLSVVLHRIAAALLSERVVQLGLTVAMIQRQYIPHESGDKSVLFTFGEVLKKMKLSVPHSPPARVLSCSSNFI